MWKYEQGTGRLFKPDGTIFAKGYAGGNEGKNKEGVNNPDLQCVHNVGPLPRGFYTLGQPVIQSHLGPFAIPLIPDKDNEMCGRGGFYCHGDRSNAFQAASEGCIIMPRAIRNAMWSSQDHELEVVKGT